MSKHERQWHFLLCLVRCIAEHNALITGTNILIRSVLVDTLCNVGRLLLETIDDGAGPVVQSLCIRIVTDFLEFQMLDLT